MIYKKILGEENPADLFTKHLNRNRIDYLLGLLHIMDAVGKAQEGLEIYLVAPAVGPPAPLSGTGV